MSVNEIDTILLFLLIIIDQESGEGGGDRRGLLLYICYHYYFHIKLYCIHYTRLYNNFQGTKVNNYKERYY
jgi:hypothetical protein